MKTAALKSAKGAYLGCLFLMMANERYKPVKKFLHEGFLAEKQQYPRDVLAMKRSVADFIGAAAAKPKRQQQQQLKSEPTGGGAFVQPEKKKKEFFVCHACGFTHKGGLDNYMQISEMVRTRTKKLIKDGVFDGAGVNATTTAAARKLTKQTRGTANTIVKEQDDGGET